MGIKVSEAAFTLNFTAVALGTSLLLGVKNSSVPSLTCLVSRTHSLSCHLATVRNPSWQGTSIWLRFRTSRMRTCSKCSQLHTFHYEWFLRFCSWRKVRWRRHISKDEDLVFWGWVWKVKDPNEDPLRSRKFMNKAQNSTCCCSHCPYPPKRQTPKSSRHPSIPLV